MGIKLPSNLHRNRHGVLYFRLNIPKDLHGYFETKVIYRSLRTSSIRLATDAVQTMALKAKHLFKELRSQPMSEKTKTSAETWNDFIQLSDLRLRIKLAGLQVAAQEQAAEIAQKEQLIANLDVEQSQMKQRHAEELQRLQRHHSESIESMMDRITRSDASKQVSGLSSPSGSVMPAIETKPTTKRLSSYVEDYIQSINANREVGDRINDQGIGDHRRTCKLLIEILGDKHLSELSVKDRNRFDDVIKRYPASRDKKRDIKNKSLEEILLMTDYDKIDLKTAKFHASRANAFLNWAFRHEGLSKPFVLMEDVRIKKGKGVKKKRREFNADELRILFSPTHFPLFGKRDERSPYKFWIPLIGLHTGARLNEIAQLRLSDIVEVDGIKCFNITEDGSEDDEDQDYLPKSVKTYAAERFVPIHTRLIELGLLEYVEKAKAQGYTMLFEDLKHAKHKYGAVASKWFASYCDKVGLADEALTFHGFRHGAVGHLRRKHVPKDIRLVVLGHSAAEDTHDNYGDIRGDISILDRKNCIEALDFSESLDFALLKRNALSVEDLKAIVIRKNEVVSVTCNRGNIA